MMNACLALLVAVLAALLSVFASEQESDGTCSGAGANPLVYNFAIDGYPAKVINDATFSGPLPGLFLEDPAVLGRALRRRFLNDTVIGAAFNVLYIDKDGEGILIDTGLGAAAFGRLFRSLEMEGISKESIKHVLLTHGHGDHLSGLVLNNTADALVPAFPSATVHLSRIEYEYWTTDPVDSGTTLRSPENQADTVRNAQAVLGAVKDNIKTFEIDEEPLPGFKPILTPWHTPGSVGYAITDGDSKLFVTGDAVSHRILTIENPWVNTSAIDFDREAGPAGRYELLDMVVKERWQLFAFHSEFPGLAYVDHCGSNFITTAAQYEGSASATAVCFEQPSFF